MREWSVHDRIPIGNVTLLSGEGGIGKSLLLLQLSAAHVLGRDWIGYMPDPVPVLYFSCEEDDDELCRRLEAIATHYRSSRSELKNKGLHLISRAGADAVLGGADGHGNVKATILFDQLEFAASTYKPRAIILDTAADIFAGNENDRSQVRQFITLLRRLAMSAQAAVIVVSHPSLQGKNSGSGLSGNTAWHNSVRARMYFKPVPSTNEGDTLRTLEFMKNNYGPVGATVVLRWRNGVYVPESSGGSLEKLIHDKRADDLFLELLQRRQGQGRSVSDKAGSTYAPAAFAGEPEAQAAGISKKKLADAMARLFAANKIRVVTEGPPSRRRSRIVENSINPSTRVPAPSTASATSPPYAPHPVEGAPGSVETDPAPSP
jgi:RecA-family ATPase